MHMSIVSCGGFFVRIYIDHACRLNHVFESARLRHNLIVLHDMNIHACMLKHVILHIVSFIHLSYSYVGGHSVHMFPCVLWC
jgi:hypothetical protein